MTQEEFTKNQSIGICRIVTRFLRRWICQNQTTSSQSDFSFCWSNWPAGPGCCKAYWSQGTRQGPTCIPVSTTGEVF